MGRVQLDSVGLPAKGKEERTKETLKNTLEPKVTYLRKEVLPKKVRSSSDSYALMPKEMLPCMLVCDATRSCHETSSKPDEVSAALLFCAKTSLRSGSRALSNSIIANSTGVLAEGRRKRPQELHEASRSKSQTCRPGPQDNSHITQ